MGLEDLERAEDDAFVQGITWEGLPVIEGREAEGLTNCMHSQVSLETKSLYARDKCFDDIVRSSDLWNVVLHGTSALSQHCKNSSFLLKPNL